LIPKKSATSENGFWQLPVRIAGGRKLYVLGCGRCPWRAYGQARALKIARRVHIKTCLARDIKTETKAG
jgi:hypothetical protein